MAPESRGAGAVFSHFFGEDSNQTGEATGEPRVSRRSWSCHLSNASWLVDQIAASRKESASKGGCPGGKTRQVFSAFFLTFCLYSRAYLTWLPISDLDVLGTVGKLALPSFSRFWIHGKLSQGWRDMVPRTEATRVFQVRRRTFFRSRFQLDWCRHRRKIFFYLFFLFFFIFLDTDTHLASVCVISISFPFRDMSCVCVCGNLCTCVHVSTNLESPPTMGNFKV